MTMTQNLINLSQATFRNYLSRKEAIEAAEKIDPMPIWNFNDWCFLFKDMEIATEEAPYYNEYALYIVMVYIVSAHGQTIAKSIGIPFSQIPQKALLLIAYYVAIQCFTEGL